VPSIPDPNDPTQPPCEDDAPLLFAVVQLVCQSVPPAPGGSGPGGYQALYDVVRASLAAAHRNKTGHDLALDLLAQGASQIAQAYVSHGWTYAPPQYQVQALIESKYDEVLSVPRYMLAKPRADDAPLLFAVVDVASVPALIPPPPAELPAEGLAAGITDMAKAMKRAANAVFPTNVTGHDVKVAAARLLAAYKAQQQSSVNETNLTALLQAVRDGLDAH